MTDALLCLVTADDLAGAADQAEVDHAGGGLHGVPLRVEQTGVLGPVQPGARAQVHPSPRRAQHCSVSRAQQLNIAPQTLPDADERSGQPSPKITQDQHVNMNINVSV